MFGKKKDNERTQPSTRVNASIDTATRPTQTNVNIVPFRFPWDRKGKVINRQYTDMEVTYDNRKSS